MMTRKSDELPMTAPRERETAAALRHAVGTEDTNSPQSQKLSEQAAGTSVVDRKHSSFALVYDFLERYFLELSLPLEMDWELRMSLDKVCLRGSD